MGGPEIAQEVLGATDEAHQLLDGVLVVVVRVAGKSGRPPHNRRRIFLTLASAQRHAELARVRGHEARVILARLQPVSGVKL